jgi:AmmeMemoRadiSam system protein B
MKDFFIASLLITFIIAGFLFFSSSKPEIQEKNINISGGVVCHHLLAESIIKDFFDYLSEYSSPETIILLGPDHFDKSLFSGSDFIGPDLENEKFEDLDVNQHLINGLSLKSNIFFDSTVLIEDHAITTLIPYIQKHFPEAKIAPFLISSRANYQEVKEFSEKLNYLAEKNSIVVASVDFSHYLSSLASEFHDLKSKRVLANFEEEKFQELEVDSWQSLYILRNFSQFKECEYIKTIAHKESNDFLKNETDSVTSYFSAVFQDEEVEKNKDWQTVLFLGDMMFDRGVEYQIKKNNFYYPFKKIHNFLIGVDVLFANLEGPIVREPKQFARGSLQFAFSTTTLKLLNFSGFDVLSLANNHTLNMAQYGLAETRELLKNKEIEPIGDPIDCNLEYVYKQKDLVITAFNKTFQSNCSNEDLKEKIIQLKNKNPNKFLIISLHWGQEYQDTNSSAQQELAHILIDAGADLIIGHHPHVVQNIEEYKGKLIFYSLGNFVFDQYFSEETQEGLAVGLAYNQNQLKFYLFPVKSHLAQPFLMPQMEAKEFLDDLAIRSGENLKDDIKYAIIVKQLIP